MSVLLDQSDDPAMRQTAARMLGRIGDRRAVAPLLAVLRDRAANRQVRVQAAQSLGMLKAPEAYEPLLQVLEDRDDIGAVRGSSMEALLRLDARRAYGRALSALDDADPTVRGLVARGLRTYGDAQALPALLRLRDQDTAVMTSVWMVPTQPPTAVPIPVGYYAREAVVQIKSRLRLPLAIEEDGAGDVVARYGHVIVRASRSSGQRERNGTPDPSRAMHYEIRLEVPDDDQLTPLLLVGQATEHGMHELRLGTFGHFTGPDASQPRVLRFLRERRDVLQTTLGRYEDELREVPASELAAQRLRDTRTRLEGQMPYLTRLEQMVQELEAHEPLEQD
jgi:hypothetical protein